MTKTRKVYRSKSLKKGGYLTNSKQKSKNLRKKSKSLKKGGYLTNSNKNKQKSK